MSSSYFVGLNAQPNLFSQIYAQKDAAASARKEADLAEQNKKYEKDADKFRIDYSKIHPYHAKEAKMQVAKFMSEADRLKKEYPHTYSNTEEYNNLFFETTSKLEDLTNSSKNIYGDFQRRADKPQDFETRQEILDAINKNDHATVQKLMGKDYFDAGDITQPRFKIEEHADLLNAGLERTETYDEKKKRNVGGSSNDYIIPYTEKYDPNQFNQITEVTFSNDPVAQTKFKTIDDYRKAVAPTVKLKSGEKVMSLQSIPAGSGSGAAIQASLSNQGQGHSTQFGVGKSGYSVNAPMRLSIVPSMVEVSAGSGTRNKTTGEPVVKTAPMKVSVGEIMVVPVYKTSENTFYGSMRSGAIVPEDQIKKAKDKGILEYKVIYTGNEKTTNARGKEEEVPQYGDISQVESSLFSKESPITDKEAFAKTLGQMKEEAKRLNKELGSGTTTRGYVDANGNKVKDIDKLTAAQLKTLIDAGAIKQQ